MLPQYLVQNSVITADVDNHIKIKWGQAAPLINFNFYTTIRRIDESSYFRYNQYPYYDVDKDIGIDFPPIVDPSSPSDEEIKTVFDYLITWDLHYYIYLDDDRLPVFRALFPASANLLVSGAQIVRNSIDYEIEWEESEGSEEDDHPGFNDSFFVAAPSLRRYVFSPNGWYPEYAAQKLNTIVREPLWGADHPVRIPFNDSTFVNGVYEIASPGFVPEYEGSDDFKYNSYYDEKDGTVEQRVASLEFAQTNAGNYPLFATPELQSTDLVWGRIRQGDSKLCINVPVTITRRLENGEYYYTIIINASSYPTSNAYLELY